MCTLGILFAASTAAYAVDPHGGNNSQSNNCVRCHTSHEASGTPLLVFPTQKEVCYSCHDGSGSTYNTRQDFGELALGFTTKTSSHPVPSGELKCSDCHTPHRGPAEGNPMSVSVGSGSEETTAGIEVCGSCHDSTPGPMSVAGTPHDTKMQRPGGAAKISCLGCHAEHASSNPQLEREVVTRSDGATVAVDTARSANPLCLACHTGATGEYPGSVALASRHLSSAGSSLAEVQYPGSGQDAGECMNCHETHGESGNAKYTRAAGETMCLRCHDRAESAYPASYSYRGTSAWSASAHADATGAVGFSRLGIDSDGFASWEGTGSPTPASPGTRMPAGAVLAMNYVDTAHGVTRLAESTGEHEYQMYRFKLPSGTSVKGLSAFWNGFAEQVEGYPMSFSIWNRTLNAGDGDWETLRSGVFGTDTTLTASFASADGYADTDGYVYFLARSKSVLSSEISVDPMATQGSPSGFLVSWSTLGPSSSWVDVGSGAIGTTYDVGTFGSDDSTSTHSVVVAMSSPGAYHYRVRSIDSDGRVTTSSDQPIGIPAPVPVDVADQVNNNGIAFSWGILDADRAPYTYQLSVRGPNAYTYTSSWLTTSSSMVTVLGGDGTYTWWVQAKDKDGVPTAASVSDTFSCSTDYGLSKPIDTAAAGIGAQGTVARILHALAGALSPQAALIEPVSPVRDVPRSIHTNAVSLTVSYALPATSGSCADCHAAHGQPQQDGTLYPTLLSSDEFRTCTGNGSGACHSLASDSASGVNIFEAFTSNSSPSAHHDVDPGVQGGTGSKIACSSCHNPHRDTAAQPSSDPSDIGTGIASGVSDYLDANGNMYALVGAQHDGIAPVISGVNVDTTNGTSPVFTWTTDEPSTSWVDIGADTSYGTGAFGDNVLTTQHSVAASGLSAGQDYHYRVRSVDALGNIAMTSDAIFSSISAPVAPTPLDPNGAYDDNLHYTDVPFSWTTVTIPDLDSAEYQIQIIGQTSSIPEYHIVGGPYSYTSAWQSGTTLVMASIPEGTYTWSVRARDAVHTAAVSSWSAALPFSNPHNYGLGILQPYEFGPLAMTSEPGPNVYSVDSDQFVLRLSSSGGAVTSVPVKAGWESAGTTPTPVAPGIAVGAGALTSAATVDGDYWRTDLATADRSWNWQVVEFSPSAAERSAAAQFDLLWTGHGEPTPTYPVALYVWNFRTNAWEEYGEADTPSTQTYTWTHAAVSSELCLRCHNGSTPDGVTMPASVTNVGASWTTLPTGDFHGARAGAGYGGSLKTPYTRGNDAIQCAVCHDAHGSSNLYHVPTTVNGQVGVTVTGGGSTKSLCAACHAGTVAEWHNACTGCHTGHNDAWAGVPDDNSDCLSCHSHNREWVHQNTCLNCHGTGDLQALGTPGPFTEPPFVPWTYHTF